MLDGQRRQVGVRREIACDADLSDQSEEYLRVTRSRLDHLHVGKFKPCLYSVDRIRDRHRVGHRTGVSHDAEEAQDRDPGQTNRLLIVDHAFPLFPGRRMAGEIAVVRVKQQVDVGNDHWRVMARSVASSSSTAANSPSL